MEGMGNVSQQQHGESPEPGRASLLSSFKKINLPMFNGESNSQVAEAWLMKINKLLDAFDVSKDQDRIALVSIQLEAEGQSLVEYGQDIKAS